MTAWWMAANAAGSDTRMTIARARRARVSVRSRAAAGRTLSRFVAVPPTATSWRIAVSGAPIRCSRAAARSAATVDRGRIVRDVGRGEPGRPDPHARGDRVAARPRDDELAAAAADVHDREIRCGPRPWVTPMSVR